jgi:hypothetical protein
MLTPPGPDPTYPTAGTGTLAAVFCEQINATTGLPGPGAVLLPGTQIFRKLD